MDTLGAFVLRRGLAEAKRWPDLYMSVNLSPLQLRDRGIVELVRATLNETGVKPGRLVLEVTEGVLIENPDEMVKRIVGMPGDRVGDRTLADDEYWVVGDYEPASTDSRQFGPVRADELKAKV